VQNPEPSTRALYCIFVKKNPTKELTCLVWYTNFATSVELCVIWCAIRRAALTYYVCQYSDQWWCVNESRRQAWEKSDKPDAGSVDSDLIGAPGLIGRRPDYLPISK